MQSIKTRPAEAGPQGLIKLTGRIKNYKCARAEANFFFTDNDRNAMGVTAVAAALVGLSGPAMGTAISASSMEEQADYVEFELDGKPVKGWVWRSPFKEKDAVEVAAEWCGNHYEAIGIARSSDRIIALYPHCSRTKTRHIMNAVKWWGIAATGFIFLLTLLISFIYFTGEPLRAGELATLALYGSEMSIGIYAVFAISTYRIARKFMPFVRLAEKVFRTLGLPDSGSIDLVKSSKAQRKPDDPGEYGTFYFRY